MTLDLDPTHRVAVALWYRVRDRVIRRAVALFASHPRVETDRLHGLLLACLLGRPVTFHDNRYGKLSRYVAEWLPSRTVKAAA